MLWAVSQQNVELVRRGFKALERALDAHWSSPRSILAAIEADDLSSEWREVFAHLDPSIEWQTMFLGNTFRGQLGFARAWDDFLNVAEDYRPSLGDVEDLGDNRVLGVVTFVHQGKEGSPRIDARFYSVFTVRDGLLLRLEEFTTREEALEAAQLQG
jgi:ketosteroid isomerase-like protein